MKQYISCKHIITTLLLILPITLAAKSDGSTLNTASPLVFIENQGQITDQNGNPRTDIDFKLETPAVNVFIGNGQLHYQWTKSPSLTHPQGERTDLKHEQNDMQHTLSPWGRAGEGQETITIYRMDVTLVGANPNAELIKEHKADYYENYYLPSVPDGVTAQSYQKITYKNVYPNIDWVIYTTSPTPSQRGEPIVKYDFVVHKGGNASDIQIRYDGATELKLENGALIATTPFGSITENAPYTYNAATKEAITSAYQLNGNILSFDIAPHNGEIIIDPQLEWATYYGDQTTEGFVVFEDDNGNVYLYGDTWGNSNIATTGTFQTSSSFHEDCFIAKFDHAGTRIWGTYMGGNANDHTGSIYVTENTIFFCGDTQSSDVIASINSYIDSAQGHWDGFLQKFNTNGQRIWGTYIGSDRMDGCGDVVTDYAGNIYLTGFTNSLDMATAGSHQDSFGGGVFFGPQPGPTHEYDGYCMKFDSSMNLIWSTYYGGSKNDALGRILLRDDKLYITGSTNSNNNIATSSVHQTLLGGIGFGYRDGILLKLDTNGTRIWCTYFGGDYSTGFSGISMDDSAYLYLCGHTNSSNNIATPGSFKDSNTNKASIGFITKFDTTGHQIWGTYYGNSNTLCNSIIVDAKGNSYTDGETQSTSGIATAGSYQPYKAGYEDYFIVAFDPYGNRIWGTYFGGTHQDRNRGGGNNANTFRGSLFVGGHTASNGLATANAHQTTLGNSHSALLAKFSLDTVVSIQYPYDDTVFCPGDTFFLAYNTNTPFRAGNSFTVLLSNSSGSFASPVTIGSRTDTVSDTIMCIIPTNTPAGNGYRFKIIADSPSRSSFRISYDIRVRAAPPSFTANTNAPICKGDTLLLDGSSSSSNITWLWQSQQMTFTSEDSTILNADTMLSGTYILTAWLGSTGCALSDTIDVLVKPNPTKPVANSNSPVCETKSINLTGSGANGVSWAWSGPGGYSSTTQSPNVTNNAVSTHAGDYILTTTYNGCSSRDTTTVVVLPKPTKPTATATNSPLCQDQNLMLVGSGSSAGATYNWYGPAAFTSTQQNPIRYQATLNHGGTYFVYTVLSGCVSDTDSVAVVVNTDPEVNVFPSPGTTICQGQQATFTTVPVNAGTATYAWLVNGIPTATGTPLQTTTLNNGDVVTCVMTSLGTCATPFYDTSTSITMIVQPLLAPSVSISANPNHTLFPNEPITFTAMPTAAGSNPTYQWKRNGIEVGGATSAVWGANANALNDGDEVCAIIYSSYACRNPDTAKSNCLTVQIKVGVDDIAKENGLSLYPNPNSGSFSLKGNVNTQNSIQVSIWNALGQTVYSRTILPVNGSINQEIELLELPGGVYMLRLHNEDISHTSRFTIKY